MGWLVLVVLVVLIWLEPEARGPGFDSAGS